MNISVQLAQWIQCSLRSVHGASCARFVHACTHSTGESERDPPKKLGCLAELRENERGDGDATHADRKSSFKQRTRTLHTITKRLNIATDLLSPVCCVLCTAFIAVDRHEHIAKHGNFFFCLFLFFDCISLKWCQKKWCTHACLHTLALVKAHSHHRYPQLSPTGNSPGSVTRVPPLAIEAKKVYTNRYLAQHSMTHALLQRHLIFGIIYVIIIFSDVLIATERQQSRIFSHCIPSQKNCL